jgi:hypothetical protein
MSSGKNISGNRSIPCSVLKPIYLTNDMDVQLELEVLHYLVAYDKICVKGEER